MHFLFFLVRRNNNFRLLITVANLLHAKLEQIISDKNATEVIVVYNQETKDA